MNQTIHEVYDSTFIAETGHPDYKSLVSSDVAGTEVVPCSKCGGGILIRRKGNYRSFWGCSNFPYCDAISEVCFTCEEGAMIKGEKLFICSRKVCGETAPICPSCGHGMLMIKYDRYGPFFGCTNWRSKGPGCKYTQDISSSGA